MTARGMRQKNNKHKNENIYATINMQLGGEIKSIGRQMTMWSAILSTPPPQRRMVKQPGNLQWHWQINKSKLTSELARLRLRINRWLESRNGETIKETNFHRPAKIRVKINMTSAKKITVTWKTKSDYSRKIVLSKAATVKAEIQRICKTKWWDRRRLIQSSRGFVVPFPQRWKTYRKRFRRDLKTTAE